MSYVVFKDENELSSFLRQLVTFGSGHDVTVLSATVRMSKVLLLDFFNTFPPTDITNGPSQIVAKLNGNVVRSIPASINPDQYRGRKTMYLINSDRMPYEILEAIR